MIIGDEKEGALTEDNLPEISEDKECLPVIENHSEVPYHDDGDMCIISDKMVAMMMKKMGKKGKVEEEFDEMEEEEEEIKPKKQNKNSRAVKKAKEERMAAAKKEKEEKLKKEEHRIKQLSEKPVSQYNYQRPVKKTNSSLKTLALKQKQKKDTEKEKEKPKVVKKSDVDIHKIFNSSGRLFEL